VTKIRRLLPIFTINDPVLAYSIYGFLVTLKKLIISPKSTNQQICLKWLIFVSFCGTVRFL